MKLTIVFCMGLFLVGCAAIKNDYFPEWKELDSFKREWFSEHLRAARENPITLPTENEIYRFTWLRSFHAPIIVRVECNEKCILNAKQLSGAGGYSPGNVQFKNKRELTTEEASKLRSVAERLDNWVYKPDEEIIGMDGAQWIFEMANSNRYQAWNLWSPGGEKAAETYVDMCLYLLNLTNFNIEKSNAY
ncbi:hypothetical protein [Alkalimonas amylolytica]|uniref:Lipoprotein n=1 Tax=Alkalimonas amylolytica TaxID=152573 RepID=A0A1H4FYT7_ALKAM|nr:hypothetical protein [Alkalimonas amylolytica]SEB02485.1 hypothetical protein SAMN04488051_11456 [Alkalimonas amylolytica]